MSGVFARLSPAARHGFSHPFARQATEAWRSECAASMEGKTCVITGAISIGQARPALARWERALS
jgi:hypothetical protein